MVSIKTLQLFPGYRLLLMSMVLLLVGLLWVMIFRPIRKGRVFGFLCRRLILMVLTRLCRLLLVAMLLSLLSLLILLIFACWFLQFCPLLQCVVSPVLVYGCLLMCRLIVYLMVRISCTFVVSIYLFFIDNMLAMTVVRLLFRVSATPFRASLTDPLYSGTVKGSRKTVLRYHAGSGGADRLSLLITRTAEQAQVMAGVAATEANFDVL